jgi:predicted AAA+ superfamily ATPase
VIIRILQKSLLELAGYYPVVLLNGPRQSGKTTLCQATFPDLPYVTFEPLDQREDAKEDPRGFLEEYNEGAIIDEVQYVPQLLNYLQEAVDRKPTPGRFILTGSQNFALLAGVSQSLAGRCGILTLLPPEYSELQLFPKPPTDLLDTLWQGSFPRIHDRNIPANRWLNDYITTYVERDVRQVTQIKDLHIFSNFTKLCAGRTAQEVNLSAVGADTGIRHNTVRSWLSVLEASFLILQLPAWHNNLRKQIVKAPKLHLTDSGLICALLGIQTPEQLRHHPLRGAIFESWVVTELYKQHLNQGLIPKFFHYREARGLEVDLIIEEANDLLAIEIKSGATVVPDFFQKVHKFHSTFSSEQRKIISSVVYGGEKTRQRNQVKALPWNKINGLSSGLPLARK